jgi:hypothetical protein
MELNLIAVINMYISLPSFLEYKIMARLSYLKMTWMSFFLNTNFGYPNNKLFEDSTQDVCRESQHYEFIHN